MLAFALVVGGLTIAAAQQPPGSDPNFTGVVTAMDAKDVTGGPPQVRSRRAVSVAQPRPGTVALRRIGAHAHRQARRGDQGIRRRRQ